MSQRILAAFALLPALAVAQASAATLRFEDVARERGVDFTHEDGSSGLKHFVETASGGGGWIDVDDDGWIDLYLVNGARTPGSAPGPAPRNRLLRNREGRLEDITDAAGVGDEGYGMGFCAGDADGDGRLDFLVTNYGPDRLYRNLGGARFEQVAEAAGVADPRWSTGCAFGDVDGDGDLDLYVARYARFRFEDSPFCGDRARGIRAYCNPSAFRGEVDSLYINDGRGRFRDEAAARGIHQGDEDRGFGVLLVDLDDDGDLDIYVANDGSLNRVYRNDGQGRFNDEGLISGAGLNARGLAEAGMGVDFGDVDGDGRGDVLVTNYSMESNTLYLHRGDLLYEDATAAFGLTEPSFRHVGWGVQFFDADADGDLDYAIANGHPIDNIDAFESTLSYLQPRQLFRNEAGRRFSEATAAAGPGFEPHRSGRGLAAGDFDNDGRVDLAVFNARGRFELLQNQGSGAGWVGFRLRGPAANRAAIGARLDIEAAGRRQLRHVLSGGGFLTQRDLRLHVGLGDAAGPLRWRLRWPDGKEQSGELDLRGRYVDLEYR